MASEIAAGADGSVYCLGAVRVGVGGFAICRWTGAEWDREDVTAVKIAVAPDGNLWFVNAGRRIIRRHDGLWNILPGTARDLAVGADGSAWCLGADELRGGGYEIRRWDETRREWRADDGAALDIAVAPDGQPWIIDPHGRILRRKANGWETLPGTAAELTLGPDGSAWCLGRRRAGTSSSPNAGPTVAPPFPGSGPGTGDASWIVPRRSYPIRRWTGSNWENIGKSALSIAIDSTQALWAVTPRCSIIVQIADSRFSSNPLLV